MDSPVTSLMIQQVCQLPVICGDTIPSSQSVGLVISGTFGIISPPMIQGPYFLLINLGLTITTRNIFHHNLSSSKEKQRDININILHKPNKGMPMKMGSSSSKISPKKDRMKKPQGASPPPPYTSQLLPQTTQPPPYTTQPPQNLDGSKLESSRPERSGLDRTRSGNTRHDCKSLDSSSICSKAIDVSPASLADLEANKRCADGAAVGKTLKFVYELEIKRRKEAEAREREEREENAKTKEGLGAGEKPQEELDFEQRLDVFRSQWAEGDYREARAQHLPRAEREKQEKWA